MSESGYITLKDIELEPSDQEAFPFSLKQVREDAELKAIQRALTHADGNISTAAKMLGITRPTLYSLLDKFGVKSDF